MGKARVVNAWAICRCGQDISLGVDNTKVVETESAKPVSEGRSS